MEKIEIEMKNGDSIEVDMSIFEIDEEKGMVNLTKMYEPFGKNVNDCAKTSTIKNGIKSIAKRMNIADTQIFVSSKGGDNIRYTQGTWAHRKVALLFALRISPDFQAWCIDALDELFQKGTVSLIPLTRVQLAEQMLENEKRMESLQIDFDGQNRSLNQGFKAVIGKHNKRVTIEKDLLGVDRIKDIVPSIGELINDGKGSVSYVKIAQELDMRVADVKSIMVESGIACWKKMVDQKTDKIYKSISLTSDGACYFGSYYTYDGDACVRWSSDVIKFLANYMEENKHLKNQSNLL